MILLNLPSQLTELCLQCNLPKNVILPANWPQIVAFLEEKYEFVEKQLSLVQQEIDEYTLQLKENFQTKKEFLIKDELLSRKDVNPLAIHSRVPSLAMLNYQHNLQKTCNALEVSLSQDYIYVQQKNIEYNQQISLKEDLIHILLYNQAIEDLQTFYHSTDTNNVYIYFINNFMLVFSLQGIFCFYTFKDINLENISEDNKENKEVNFRYYVINQLSDFFSAILGETNHTLIHLYQLDQTKFFINYQNLLTLEKIELLKEFCLSEGNKLVL